MNSHNPIARKQSDFKNGQRRGACVAQLVKWQPEINYKED